jgi:hypothetical protein
MEPITNWTALLKQFSLYKAGLDKEDARLAREEYTSGAFALSFSFKKGGHQDVMSTDENIARYRKLKGRQSLWDPE